MGHTWFKNEKNFVLETEFSKIVLFMVLLAKGKKVLGMLNHLIFVSFFFINQRISKKKLKIFLFFRVWLICFNSPPQMCLCIKTIVKRNRTEQKSSGKLAANKWRLFYLRFELIVIGFLCCQILPFRYNYIRNGWIKREAHKMKFVRICWHVNGFTQDFSSNCHFENVICPNIFWLRGNFFDWEALIAFCALKIGHGSRQKMNE